MMADHPGDVAGIAEHHGGQIPGNLGDIIGSPATALTRRLQVLHFLGKTLHFGLHFHLGSACQGLVGLRPLRHADLLDIRVQSFGQRFIEVAGPSGCQDALRHAGVRHLGRSVGNAGADRVQVADPLVIPFPEEVPDGGLGRHDVRLISTVDDHIMRAVVGPEVLAAEVPSHVHEFYCIQSAAAHPRGAGPMGALTVETILRRNQAGAGGAVGSGEIAANVGAQHYVQVAKEVRIDHVRAAGEQLLGNPRVDAQGAGNFVLLHQILDGDRSRQVYGLTRVVAFAMSGAIWNQRRVIGDAGFLGGFR